MQELEGLVKRYRGRIVQLKDQLRGKAPFTFKCRACGLEVEILLGDKPTDKEGSDGV
jgi:hypothetical protein